MSSIQIKTSISDALDRLSILDVKLLKIQDEEKIKEIRKEKSLIEKKMKDYKSKVEFYYEILVEINEKIWDLLDKAKYDSNTKEEALHNFRSQEDYNERRHRVKKKIDNFLNSDIKEQKGYKQKKAFVLGHLGVGDQLDDVGIVRYLSTLYDEVKVIAKNKSFQNIYDIYKDDSSIVVVGVENDHNVSPYYGFPVDKFNANTKDYDVYLMGFHKHGLKTTYPSSKMYDLPVSFYDDVGIPFYVFWKYFHMHKNGKEEELFQLIKNSNIEKYIFIHNSSSIGQIFKTEDLEKHLNIDKNKILFINPCCNSYKIGDPFFDLAQKFVYKNILDYTTIIENASKVVLTDSGFCSMAIHLPIKTEECYIVYRRGETYNYSYKHLWTDKYKPKTKKYRIFTSLKL